MNQERVWSHKLRNLLHSVLLLAAMVILLAWIGVIFFGAPGVTLAILAGAALLTLGRVSPRWILRMHRARPLSPHGAPGLYRLVGELARRAGLRRAPALYFVPSPATNAFAVGNAEESAIGVTQGLLRSLDRAELAGVLAHEISHIRHRDLWVMGLAQLLGRMTRNLSWLGQLMLLVSFPAMLMGGFEVPWAAVLVLVSAPILSALLQLALSRTREFEADLGAARLTGDPLGLASALNRLEAHHGGWWRLFVPVRRRQESSLLDSHPATAERVERLESLVDRRQPQRVPVRFVGHEPRLRLSGLPPVVRLPRRVVGSLGF